MVEILSSLNGIWVWILRSNIIPENQYIFGLKFSKPNASKLINNAWKVWNKILLNDLINYKTQLGVRCASDTNTTNILYHDRIWNTYDSYM